MMYANWFVCICETDRVEQNNQHQRRCVVLSVDDGKQSKARTGELNCILLRELTRMAGMSCSSNIIGEITMTRFVLLVAGFSK